MAKRKFSVSEIASIIESEGLGYAIQHYMSGANIVDQDLAELWDRAADLLNEIQEYVEENADDVVDDVSDGDDGDDYEEEY